MLTALHKTCIQNVHLFKKLSPEQLQNVFSHAHVTRLEKDQILFSQGDHVEYFYLTISGMIKLYRLSLDGQEKVIELAKPNETFAEALVFSEQPLYPVAASALADSEVIAFEVEPFLSMLRNNSEVCMILLAQMSQRLRGLVQEIDRLSIQTGKQRLCAYLLEHVGNTNHVQLSMPKSVLASRLSIKPETFSRIIKRLKTSNAIEVHGAHIEILDIEQLKDDAFV